ncbi:MAG TPA: hypothetical protein VK636_12135 [Gemmatimonadaceae bacterium]|nr:hypothetical protein [Gemmatimonadaceae bacterium]
MRGLPVVLAGVVVGVGSLTSRVMVPPSCYVANTAVIWHGDPDYTIHRIITTGIRRYDDAGQGTIAQCAPKDSADIVANRAALARVVDSLRVEPPLTMNRLELAARSEQLILSQLVSLDAKARAHSDRFLGLEIVEVKRANGAEVSATALPAFSKTPSETESCKARNENLQRSASRVRWAC